MLKLSTLAVDRSDLLQRNRLTDASKVFCKTEGAGGEGIYTVDEASPLHIQAVMKAS